MPGPSEVLADSLVRGLADVDFVVWSAGSGPFRAPKPPNLVGEMALPTWSAASGDGRGGWRRTRPSPREVEREFVPPLRAFLEATIDPDGPGERLAATLLELREALVRWDPVVTWRSRAAWHVVRDHLLVRTPDPGGDAVEGPGEPWASEELPTIGEAAEALSWLGRVLAPLSLTAPHTDLVHATAAGFSALPGILARVERGTPMLLSEHSVAPRDAYLALVAAGAPFHLKRFAGNVSGAVGRTVYRLADRLAPACRHTMRWELAFGAPRSRTKVVEPGLDDERYRRLDVPRSKRPTVVQVSPIGPESDPATMLGVAERVRAEIPDVMFLHSGPIQDLPTWERVRELRHVRGLDDTIRFNGPVDDVPRALALADVALVTSRSEILPLAVLEASMCGVPVVATDTGGVREALAGAGIVVPVGDADALAEGVAATLRVSSEQRDRVRQAARDQAVARFGLRRFLRDHRRLYAELGLAVAEPATATQPVPNHARDHVVVIPDVAAGEAADGGDPANDETTPADVGDALPAIPPAAAPEPEGAVVPSTEPEARPGPPGAEASSLEVWLATAGTRDPAPSGPHQPSDASSGERDGDGPRPDRELVAGSARPEPGSPAWIRERLAHPDPAVRAAVLRDLDDPAAVDAAAIAMADDVALVRQEATRALGRLDGPRAGRWLVDVVTADPSPEVRAAAVDALAALIARQSPGGGRGRNR